MTSPPKRDARPRVLHTLTATVLVAFAYYAFGRLGLLLALPPGYATPVWPASGVALAAVLRNGMRVSGGVWLGSLCVNLGLTWSAGEGVVLAVGAGRRRGVGHPAHRGPGGADRPLALAERGQTLDDVTLLNDGTDLYVRNDQQEVFDVLMSGQGVFAIALAPLRDSVTADVVGIPTEIATPMPTMVRRSRAI